MAAEPQQITVKVTSTAAEHASEAARKVAIARKNLRQKRCFRINDVEDGWWLILLLLCLGCFVYIVISTFAPEPVGLLRWHPPTKIRR